MVNDDLEERRSRHLRQFAIDQALASHPSQLSPLFALTKKRATSRASSKRCPNR
jgi:hypothetical protein